ncbi:MAG TPA: glutamine synthetase family protein [Candidatus Cybelea sp.]|nr:glutamine synthetase family protein [Candidatus Cybelea sp.]
MDMKATAQSHSGIATVEECDAFLAAHPGIENVQIFFVNQSGVPRGKNLRRRDIRPVFEYARMIPGTMLALDINGGDVEESGFVMSDGDADRLGRPVPGTLAPAPWLGDDFAQVMLSVYELDGTPCIVDPRHVLQGVIDRFKELDLTPVVACELEFYVIDRKLPESGGRQGPASPVTGHRSKHIQGYGLRELDDFQPFLQELYAHGEAAGLPLESSISENAPGQLEVGLVHRADALRATDEAAIFKRVVKGTAVRHGFEATFMAKPHNDLAGSGQHLHVSLADRDGRNVFAADGPEGDALMRYAIGGMKALLEESMAIFAPNANSYKRFQANLYAPVAPTWGVNNRTVGFRVTAGAPSSRHIEHRISGADANPALAVAAMLAAVHHGIKHRIDPGPPIVGDGYVQAAQQGWGLPRHWVKTLDAFEASAAMKDYLGPRFHHMFTAIKRAEHDRFMSQVTELDYEWYLRNA